jgi:hypothetical protein
MLNKLFSTVWERLISYLHIKVLFCVLVIKCEENSHTDEGW